MKYGVRKQLIFLIAVRYEMDVMRVKFRDTIRIRSYNGKKNQCTLHKRIIQNKEPSAKGSKQITHTKKKPSIISYSHLATDIHD